MTGSSSTGTNWSVDYLGNEFLAGNITATGIRDKASLTYTGSSVGLNNSSCGITVFDSNNSANTFTINVGLPVGCQADVVQEGTGTITFAGASGDSIVIHQRGTSPSHTSLGQYSRAHIIVDAANTILGGSYVLSGDVN